MDWSEIASKLLASSTPVAAVAGAIEEAGKVANHFLEDDPVKQAKFWREYNKKLEDYILKIQEVKDGEDVTGIVASYNDDFMSK